MFSRGVGLRRRISRKNKIGAKPLPGEDAGSQDTLAQCDQEKSKVRLEVIQSGLLGLRRSLGKVRPLRALGFNLDFSSFQSMELGQRLRLVFHSGKGRLREFCGYIISRQDKGHEHEYSVALEAEDNELEELRTLAASAGMEPQVVSAHRE